MESTVLIEKIKASYMSKAQLKLPDVEATAMCVGCGHCCRALPGIVDPDDVEKLEDLLNTGRYAIDYWEADGTMDQTYFIRPAIKGSEGRLVHPAWGGECTFLTDTGCELRLEDRPANCRQLVPKTVRKDYCTDVMTKQARVFRWAEYQGVIEDIIRRKRDG